MSLRPVSLLLLIPLFAGCQSLAWQGDPPPRPSERLQGELRVDGDQLQFRSCQGERHLRLIDASDSGLLDDAQALANDGGAPLFVDVRGALLKQNNQDRMEVSQVYRVQAEGPGCGHADFRQSILVATGNEPGWHLRITRGGMLLERPDQAPLALPYLEEQLPSGQLNFTSEANSQQVGLWIAPQRCVDISTGTVSHLTAELRLDGKLLRGCGYFGGARNN